MRKSTLPLLAAGLLLIACDNQAPLPTSLKTPTVALDVGDGNGVQHRVSVGSHDFTPPGYDANFSLIAIEHRDGTVTGQWQDTFGPGNGQEGGYHVAVDCVTVIGNTAWIGGVVTKATNELLVGTRALTEVRDNGTSSSDTPDQISYSYAGLASTVRCPTPTLPLFPLEGGEVKVD